MQLIARLIAANAYLGRKHVRFFSLSASVLSVLFSFSRLNRPTFFFCDYGSAASMCIVRSICSNKHRAQLMMMSVHASVRACAFLDHGDDT